jgi:hypothetical protein
MATRQPRVPGAEAPAHPEAENDALKPVLDADKTAQHVAESLGVPAALINEASDDETYREQAKGLRAKDVDATRLRRSVLTLDGWVCPATSPAPKGKE